MLNILSIGAHRCVESNASLPTIFPLKDFEAVTPNLLARTVETVEGGGLVVLLLRTMSSLKQLYTMAMVCILNGMHFVSCIQSYTCSG